MSGTILLLIGGLLLGGCQKQDAKTPEPTAKGTVKATQAYLDSFGQPPTAKQGDCFARVGYYPLRSAPEKVRALPFFLFQESGQLQMLLDRLVGTAVSLPEQSDLFNPFPPGTRVKVTNEQEDAVSLDLSFSGKAPEADQWPAITAALTETASQFPGTARVFILAHGKPLPAASGGGFRHDVTRIAPPGPPALFMIVGSWEKGKATPEEVVANFDRPVRIKEFRLEQADGSKLEGEYFQSIFDMAVVLKPKDPASLYQGMALRASWDVSDYLGRQGQGVGTFELQRYEHPAEAAVEK